MRFLLAVLLVLTTACKGADFAPDEFRVDYGVGNATNNFDHRNVDFETDSQWVSFGLSWNIGRTYQERALERAESRVDALTDRMLAEKREPITVTPLPGPPPPTPHVEPKKDDPKETPQEVEVTGFSGAAREYMLYAAGALLLAIAAVLKRKFLIEGTVTVARAAREKVRGKKKGSGSNDERASSHKSEP